jgi:hypothetical protein
MGAFFHAIVTTKKTYLDGDKVGLTLVGNGLGKQSFTTSRRSIEKDTLGRLHAKLEELFGVLDGVLDRFLQLLFNFFQASNVLP